MDRKKVPWEDVSEAFLDSLFYNSPEAIVMLDNQSRVIRTNGEFDRLFGHDPEEIIGKHIDSLIAGPQERDEAASYSLRAERGEHLEAESVRRRKDGSTVEVSILGAPVEKEGRIIGIFGIYRDITGRKAIERKLAASEASYRDLVEDAPVGIFQSSSDGYFLRVNQQVADILGCTSPGDVLEHYHDLGHTLYYREGGREEFMRQLREQEFIQNYEFEALKKDAEIIWISVSCRISRWMEDGSFIMDGFLTDKTKLKQAEQKLHHSLKEKDILLQEVHHRVKNNMQIISSLLNLEFMNYEDSAIQELLSVIQSRIQTMSMVHEKLYNSGDVSRVELSEYSRELIMQIVDMMEEEKPIELEFKMDRISATLDFSVPYGLILNELVMNACKHAFRGIAAPKLKVGLRNDPDGILLRLRDNGVGLPGGFSSDRGKTLGMSLIESLVEQLRGDIAVNNENGTEWVIRFPVEIVS